MPGGGLCAVFLAVLASRRRRRSGRGGRSAEAGDGAELQHAFTPSNSTEAAMMRMMGFGGFGTTQGKHVEDEFANASAVQKKTKRQARQYMNRVGGFNRPLPAEVTGQRQNRT